MADDTHTSAPFEGPEKLLEIWFAPSARDLPDAALAVDGRFGLRKIERQVWEEMLDIVKCKVLSMVQGSEIDAYLLSESSFFVSPHRLILKTCGTTLNLLGLPRMLEIARNHAGLSNVYRCFYSRKAFMFPERQLGPHRDWKDEIKFLDDIFANGAAYTVGKVNGDHWLLYMTSPGGPDSGLSSPIDLSDPMLQAESEFVQDYTIEILMSDLSKNAREPFFSSSEANSAPSAHAQTLSETLGISAIFPPAITTLDAYNFSPCGYSSNALIKWGGMLDGDSSSTRGGEGYYTIHVTPEEGWSYASFECNVPLSTHPSHGAKTVPDLHTLIRRVVEIFQPGRLSLTLFISSQDNTSSEDSQGETAIEAAQRTFKAALVAPIGPNGLGRGISNGHPPKIQTPGRILYQRTDKINYEFGGYDLAFASFERCSVI